MVEGYVESYIQKMNITSRCGGLVPIVITPCMFSGVLKSRTHSLYINSTHRDVDRVIKELTCFLLKWHETECDACFHTPHEPPYTDKAIAVLQRSLRFIMLEASENRACIHRLPGDCRGLNATQLLYDDASTMACLLSQARKTTRVLSSATVRVHSTTNGKTIEIPSEMSRG